MRKVAILAHGASASCCPIYNTDLEIWGLNHRFRQYAKFDRWFDLHNMSKQKIFFKEYFNFLARNQEKVWIAEHCPDLPNANIYPKDAIIKEFGDYFTNTISWLVALALFEGVNELHLYGVEMALTSEYAFQKPSLMYFLGIARGSGVNLVIPEKSKLFQKNGLYWPC